MNTHRLSVLIGLWFFAWGCGADRPSSDLESQTREAKVKTASGSNGTPDCNSLTLSASPPSTEPSGTPIVLTADGGCASAEYRFLYKPIGGESCGHGNGCGPWIELRGFGGPTYTFDTTGLAPGRYHLRAQARTEGEDDLVRTLLFEFTEACAPGYHSDGAGTCVDIDECLTNNGACDPLTTCTNLPGSRACGPCPSGYTGTGDTVCVDIDECLIDNGGCDLLTTCTNLPGNRLCGPCPAGYDGDGETGCVDIDECLTNNGGCDLLTTCTNTPGSRVCGPCPTGYAGTGDTVCVDIDECLIANGACDPLVTCTNLVGSRSCGACPEGYAGTGDTACMKPFVASELVGRPTDHSVTINAMAGQGLEAYVEYGTAAGEYTGNTAAADYADGIIETVADGLAADTRYYYRLRYRPSTSTAPFLAGSEHTFQTQRPAGSTFTFAVQSDSHQGYTSFHSDALYRITMQNIAGEQPDFLVDLGDTVSTDAATETQATVRQKYLAQRTIFGLAAHSMPVFLALGNHENEEGWNLNDKDPNRQDSLPVLGANARKRYFLNPAPDTFYTGNTDVSVPEIDGDHLKEDYYAFAWGDALFVVIDPFWYTMKKPYGGATGGEKEDETVGNRWDWTLGTQQYQWLKQTLESSDAKFKFVFAHQATGGLDDYIRGGALGAKFCEWGGYDPDGVTWSFESHRPGWELPIHQLFMRTGVSTFFHGHDHVFAKEELNQIVYQEVPFAANAKYGSGFGTNPEDYLGGDLVNNSGHLRVTVAPTGATVEYVRSYLDGDGTNGAVSYSYVIPPFAERDSDDDDTNDSADGCPLNGSKTEPGVCGCGTTKMEPGICGCGQPDIDSDGDGAFDCVDGCPSDLNKIAPGRCGCGHDDSGGCDRFMVVRVGDGSATLTVSSTAAFIQERRLDDGDLINTTPLPITASGSNKPLTLAGSAYVEGTLKRSFDRRYVTLAGYGTEPGLANVAQTVASTVNRVVARISSDHTVDTTTAVTNGFNGASGTNANDRVAVTFDGSAFWVGGVGTNNSGGIWYIPFGTTGGTQIIGQSDNAPGDVRACGIFNGQLYGATKASPFFGVFTVGTGLPTGTPPMAAATQLPGFPTSGNSSPMDFAVLDRDPNIAGVDTIYLADDRAPGSGGGIQKWTFNGTTWTLAYTLKNGLSTGVRHLLAIEVPNDGVMLLAGTTSTPNAIVKVIDTGSGSMATTLVTAGAKTAFRGLALSPEP
jgi:hypothetical protein